MLDSSASQRLTDAERQPGAQSRQLRSHRCSTGSLIVSDATIMLFRAQVGVLKKGLTDAERQLGAQSRQLRSQWRKSILLETSTKLLDDVAAVTEAPARIEAAVSNKVSGAGWQGWLAGQTCLQRPPAGAAVSVHCRQL